MSFIKENLTIDSHINYLINLLRIWNYKTDIYNYQPYYFFSDANGGDFEESLYLEIMDCSRYLLDRIYYKEYDFPIKEPENVFDNVIELRDLEEINNICVTTEEFYSCLCEEIEENEILCDIIKKGGKSEI